MSEKLAVLFPGVGYQIDRPLLYHSAKLARERGYEVCTVSYPPLPTGLRGKPERIQQAIELCSPRRAPNSCPELCPINTNSSCLSLKVSERQLRRSAPPGFSLSPQQVYYRRSRTRLRISDAKVWFSTVPQTPGRAPRS